MSASPSQIRGEGVRERRLDVGRGPVAHRSPACGDDQPRVAQLVEVVHERREPEVEEGGELRRGALLITQQSQDAQAAVVAERAQGLDERGFPLDFLRSDEVTRLIFGSTRPLIDV